MSAFWSGFFTSLSLILAIGAQNAFVLKQGIKKEHVFAVCLICALGDALLIFAGVLVLQKCYKNLSFLNRLPYMVALSFYLSIV